MDEKEYCPTCDKELEDDSDFCPVCGSIFVEAECFNHTDKEAAGVCIVCQYAFCEECGSNENNIFKCNEHKDIEIINFMARVYGDLTHVKAEYVKTCLENNDLHPMILDMSGKKNYHGGIGYMMRTKATDAFGHPPDEIKVMVPLNEFIEAMEVIEEIDDQTLNELPEE